MRHRRLTPFTVVACLLGLAAAAVAELPTDASVDLVAARYEKLVRHLASDEMEGRGPGTAGLDKARDYLVEQFKAADLQPAFGEQFTQAFEVPLGIEAEVQKLRVGGKPMKAGEHYNPLALGGSGKFAGKPLFLGYGIANPEQDYDSFAQLEDGALRDRIVVFYRYEPIDENNRSRWAGNGWSSHAHLINKAKAAAKRGAAALIIVNPATRADARLLRPSQTVAGESVPIPVLLGDHDLMLALLGGRDADAAKKRARELQNIADTAGAEGHAAVELDAPVRGEVKLTTRAATAHNVAAVLPGEGELKDQWLVVGGHYDHLGKSSYGSRTGADALHPGADDNASGTAAVVMVAEQLAKAVAAQPLQGERGRRSVLFIGFSGEERGLIGSRYFVRHLEDAGLKADQIKAMINLDMVGRLREQLLVLAGDTSTGWKPLFEQAAKPLDLTVRVGGAGMGPSDHSNFYPLGIPVVHLFTGTTAEYHTPKDTAETINFTGGAKIVRLVTTVTGELAIADEPLDYQSPQAIAAAGGGAGGRAFLGIQLGQPGDDVKGVAVAGVVPNGPASDAGLQAGDQIVALGDTQVEDFGSLAAALGRMKPGDKVEVRFHRDGEPQTAELTLGSR